MATGAAWMVLFKLLDRTLGLLSILVLARLLTPADFGIVAMASATIAVLELLGAFSLDLALIQNQNTTRKHYDTAWTFNILANIAIALLMLLIAAPSASFFREPRVEYVIYGLAAGVFVQGFENVGVVAFRKELMLNREFGFLLAKRLIGVITGVVLAIAFRSYWALVAGSVASQLAGVALSYVLHPFRPRLSLAARRELIHFSKWLFINNILFVGNHKAPDFIIGRLSGSTTLGIYNLGHEIANLPTTELAAPINRAVYPGYAAMARDPGALRTAFLGVASSVALIAIPAAAGLAALAGDLVGVLLGEQWTACIPIIQILSIQGLLVALQTNAGYVFIATGNPRTVTGLASMRLAILVPSLLVGTAWGGVVGAASGALCTTIAMLPFNYAAIFRTLSLGLRDYGAILWRPLLAAGCMLLALDFCGRLLDGLGSTLAQLAGLIASVLVGAVVYVVTVFLFWSAVGRPTGAESRVLGFLGAKLGRTVIEEPPEVSKAK